MSPLLTSLVNEPVRSVVYTMHPDVLTRNVETTAAGVKVTYHAVTGSQRGYRSVALNPL